MMRFDHSDHPFWTQVGEGYLCLLDPLWVETDNPIAGREPYIRTLRQIGARPTSRDLQTQGFVLTQAMPALAVHIREGRVQGRTSTALEWQLDIDIHCFCGAMDQGDQLRQDDPHGIRSLTHHVVEHLHMRVLPDFDAQGVHIEAIEHIITNERVDWWVVSTTVEVWQEIRRQRTPQVISAPISGSPMERK